MRQLPLSMRKANLARLLARRTEGIFIAPFEQGEIGPDLFRAACNMGLEGLVSKRRDRPYRAGRSPHWEGEKPKIGSDDAREGYRLVKVKRSAKSPRARVQSRPQRTSSGTAEAEAERKAKV
jgi:ATP-dependent DNA ligase